jgi:AraC family transcriptional activator FtrA
MLTTVAVIVIDGSTPFEFGVLCEVFGFDRRDDGVPPMEFLVCGEKPGEPVRLDVGGQLIPEHGLDAVARADLVAMSAATIRDDYPPAVLQALRDADERGAIILSVCSGAFILGAAGLLDGRRCKRCSTRTSCSWTTATSSPARARQRVSTPRCTSCAASWAPGRPP